MMRWTMGALALLALSGCPGFGDKTAAELAGITDEVTYHADIRPILETHCTSCHGAPPRFGAPNSLVEYAQARGLANRIQVRAVQEGSMPPGGGLSDAEKGLIDAWISGGLAEGVAGVELDMAPEPDMAPEVDMGPVVDMDPNADMGPDMAPPPPPTWDGDIVPIMEANCAFPGCHGGGMPASNLDLTSYAGFTAGGFGGDLTGGGDPTRSGLIDRLRARDGLPLMPQGGPALDDADIELCEAWIAAGAPEN